MPSDSNPTAEDVPPIQSGPTAEDALTSTEAFGDGIDYDTKKDSLETDPRRDEFKRFAEVYCRNLVDAGSPKAKIPLPQLTPDIETLRNDISTGSGPEASGYPNYACLLTRLSLHLCEGSKDALVFRPYSDTVFRGMVQASANNKPDLIAYFAPYDVTKKLVDNAWDLQALTDAEREIFIVKVPVQKTSSFVECKTLGAAITKDKNRSLLYQVIRYLHMISRHDPASVLHYGLTADRKGFQLVAFGLDECSFWTKVPWSDAEWLGKLLTCVEMIISQARASSNPTNETIPKLQHTFPTKSHYIATYSATVGGKQFRLIPLFYGRGNGRKPFVALAVAVDNPKEVRVFKYSWCTSAQKGREHMILEQLRGVPGIVQIDTDLSMDEVEKEIPLENKAEGGRTLGLVVLKTVGRPLSSCRSVREFLMAMFDLIEVLRNLDQKGIIHRDISWGNVLIPLELPGTSDVLNKGNTSTQAAPSDIDRSASMSKAMAPKDVNVATYIENEGNKRPCRFLSDVRGENDNGPRVALADFDHAASFNNSSANLKNVTGTPMFMAVDVLQRRRLAVMTFTGPGLLSFELQSLFIDCPKLYGDDVNEKNKWDEFYRVSLKKLAWVTSLQDVWTRTDAPDQITNARQNVEDDLARTFKHQAVHDIESVFYICVLFFVRMWPKGAKIPEARKSELQGKRGRLFRQLIRKEISETMIDLTESLEFVIEGVDIPEMKDFQAMLREMWYYIKVPWYNIKDTGKGATHEYHSHDALRRILLRRIDDMDTKGDEILVEENPLIMNIPELTKRQYTPTAFLTSNVPSTSESSDVRNDDPKSGQKRNSEATVPQSSGAFKRPRGSREASTSSRPARDVVMDESTGEKMINPVDVSPEPVVPKEFEDLRVFVDLAWQMARSAAWLGV